MAIDEQINVYIGYDSRESAASYVAAHSILRRTKQSVTIHHLKHRDLRKAGIFVRPWLINGNNGETVDILDGRTFSTEFSHTRFLVPHLMNYQGWALFMDADMIFLSDIKKLFELRDDKYAVMCVKHAYPITKDKIKMDGRAQRFYNRKNWSSFVLWNCGHPANEDITPEKVNFLPGADLHAFCWLQDYQIGALPITYNYITGISPNLPPDRKGIPDVIHYTDGGPWFDECRDVTYAELWVEEFERWQRDGEGNKYCEIPSTRYEI